MSDPHPRVVRAGLDVDAELDAFVADELLAPLGIDPEAFWSGFAALVATWTPRHHELLARRDELQRQLDEWHREHRGAGDPAAYAAFLTEIGYLEADAGPVTLDVSGVDAEIATIAGPQLVVPLSNARYALNAANARWGSLYDALYGTDAVSREPGEDLAGYDPARGARVIAATDVFLDQALPLADGAWSDVVGLDVAEGSPRQLVVSLAGGRRTGLADPGAFAGFADDGARRRLLLRHHGLHVEVVVDETHPVGAQHPAHVADVRLESAITTIQDCEDSVAAVDAADKVVVYRNWLGLMRGTLTASFEKGGGSVTRSLVEDRTYTAPDGGSLTVPGRSLLLVRNVGHHMTTDAVRTPDGNELFEGLLDAAITVAAAAHDLRGLGRTRNSQAGSVYVVKPKQHGSAEVACTAGELAAVEQLLGLAPATVKIGIMDEERRTSLNLTQCIAAARDRVIFINTGFLDRTGDEIHSAMEAGPVVRKEQMRATSWLAAYEDHNVDVGLAAGFAGNAQIGKGMWAMPDAMAAMVETKIGHPRAGASTAWVPSPTAATLHAMHYHLVDVAARQAELAKRPPVAREAMLVLPLLDGELGDDEITEEIANNAQGILGYVVRWIEQGVGCSKVPDVRNVDLMEDRATLRISSQHLANWLRHGIVEDAAVRAAFVRMAGIVDAQNAGDPVYVPMAADPEHHPAFLAALDLVFTGTEVANGYTEPVLHAWRRRVKAGEFGAAFAC